ncbi:MAG: hypothetical protein D6739_12145, partial [Nitrospirae bacterium]
YLPRFARVAEGHAPAAAGPRTLAAAGWLPATGGRPPAAAGPIEEGPLAETPFWPRVAASYRALYAGGEE